MIKKKKIRIVLQFRSGKELMTSYETFITTFQGQISKFSIVVAET